MLAAGMDRFEIFRLLSGIIVHAATQHFSEAQDGIHRRPDFMTHVGEKGTLGLVGGFGRSSRFGQFNFLSFQSGDVFKTAEDASNLVFAAADGSAVHLIDSERSVTGQQPQRCLRESLFSGKNPIPRKRVWFQ